MPPVKLEAARFGGGAADSTPQYGPIKGAAKFRQNSAGHWIHSETGRFASLSDLHEMHGALGAPLIVPRVVDSATGEVLRNPEPRVEWNAPAIQTSGVVQGANIQHQQHGYGFPSVDSQRSIFAQATPPVQGNDEVDNEIDEIIDDFLAVQPDVQHAAQPDVQPVVRPVTLSATQLPTPMQSEAQPDQKDQNVSKQRAHAAIVRATRVDQAKAKRDHLALFPNSTEKFATGVLDGAVQEDAPPAAPPSLTAERRAAPETSLQIVIAKCNCSSSAAWKVLEECNGDVIDAVALLRVRAQATAAGVTNSWDDEDLAGAVDDEADAATFVSTPREFSSPREHDSVPPTAQPHRSPRTGTADDEADERDVFMQWMKEQTKAQQQQTQVLQQLLSAKDAKSEGVVKNAQKEIADLDGDHADRMIRLELGAGRSLQNDELIEQFRTLIRSHVQARCGDSAPAMIEELDGLVDPVVERIQKAPLDEKEMVHAAEHVSDAKLRRLQGTIIGFLPGTAKKYAQERAKRDCRGVSLVDGLVFVYRVHSAFDPSSNASVRSNWLSRNFPSKRGEFLLWLDKWLQDGADLVKRKVILDTDDVTKTTNRLLRYFVTRVAEDLKNAKDSSDLEAISHATSFDDDVRTFLRTWERDQALRDRLVMRDLISVAEYFVPKARTRWRSQVIGALESGGGSDKKGGSSSGDNRAVDSVQRPGLRDDFKRRVCNRENCRFSHELAPANGAGSRPKRTQDELAKLCAAKPCCVHIAFGKCDVRDCPFDHKKESIAAAKAKECPRGKDCWQAQTFYKTVVHGKQVSKCPYLHDGKSVQTRTAPVKADLIIRADSISANDEVVCPWTENLPCWGRLDPGAEAHCTESVLDSGDVTGVLSLSTVTGTSDAKTGFADTPFGSRESVAAGKNLYSSGQGITEKDIVGHSHFTEWPSELVIGSAAVYRKKHGRVVAYPLAVERGVAKLPADLENARHFAKDGFIQPISRPAATAACDSVARQAERKIGEPVSVTQGADAELAETDIDMHGRDDGGLPQRDATVDFVSIDVARHLVDDIIAENELDKALATDESVCVDTVELVPGGVLSSREAEFNSWALLHGMKTGAAHKRTFHQQYKADLARRLAKSQKLLPAAADDVLRGGTSLDEQKANFKKAPITKPRDATQWQRGHCFADITPVTDVSYRAECSVALVTDAHTEWTTGTAEVDKTADAIFHAVVVHEADAGKVEVLSGDAAKCFTGSDELFAKHNVLKEPVNPDHQNANLVEPRWGSRIKRRMLTVLNRRRARPPRKAWPLALTWSVVVANLTTGAWRRVKGVHSEDDAVERLYGFGQKIIVRDAHPKKTFDAKGRICCYVAPTGAGSVKYTEWELDGYGGRRLAAARVTADYKVIEGENFFDDYAGDDELFDFVEDAAPKEFARRKRGRPPKRVVEVHRVSRDPCGVVTAGSEGVALEVGIQPIPGEFWDHVLATGDTTELSLVLDAVEQSLIDLERCGFAKQGDQARNVDVVRNVGAKKAFSSDLEWLPGSSETMRDRFLPAAEKEFKGFEDTGSYDWTEIHPRPDWVASAKDIEQFPHGIIENLFHPLAGQKGYENAFKQPEKVKAKLRVVVHQEVDIVTRRPRDGRLPDETFDSQIPSHEASATQATTGHGKQMMAVLVDETTAFPSVPHCGVFTVGSPPQIFWDLKLASCSRTRAVVDKFLADGWKLADLLMPNPQANYGKFRSNYRYEIAARAAKESVGWEATDVRGLYRRDSAVDLPGAAWGSPVPLDGHQWSDY